MTRRFTA